jgi:hypothetical protein
LTDDPYYRAKFTRDGEVVDGWSFDHWIEERLVNIPKSPSPDTVAFRHGQASARQRASVKERAD